MGTHFSIFRWTLCSGHSWDVFLMRVWTKGGRQWVGCVGHQVFVAVFGIFVIVFDEFEHVFTSTVVIALHTGCITHTFRASAHTTAVAHSPDMLSSICSHGLGLERGWFAKRSLCLQKEMSCVLQPLLALLPFLAPALQSSWHDVPLQVLNHTKTSRTPPLHPAGNPFSTPPFPPLAHQN